MTHYVWAEVRERAVRRFRGDEPRAETEQAVLDVFQREPRRVIEAIEHVGQEVERGGVRSGWAVLRAHLGRAENAVPNVVATDESERARKVALAETRIRNAALLIDRQDELEDELFGERGLLKAWADDEALRRQVVEFWREQRPTGERIEREAEERMAHYRETRDAAER